MENKDQPIRCSSCKYFASKDTGYSNYTVEGTDIVCLKKHFDWIEESYSWRNDNNAAFFKQAETCTDYKKEEGVQVALDVDGEISIDDFKSDEEVYIAAKEFGL